MPLATNLRPRRAALLLAAGLVLVSTGCTTSGMQTAAARDAAPTGGMRSATDVLASWPATQQETARLMMAKYGQPTVVSDRMIAWHDTRGELSAQCDVEEMNWLALNLAHDVAMGRRTPADARVFYGKTAMAFKQGDKSSPYVRGLMFQREPDAADPDCPMQM